MDEQQQLFYLQQDLEVAFQREQALLNELHNLTASMTGLQRREELHVHQLDVLTERVMDVETAAARDRNEALEYQANCTELSLQLAQQQGDVDEWRAKCSELVEMRNEDEKKIRELKKKLKAASREAEALAEMVERHRLRDEGTTFHKKKQKKRGFFAWLFGFSVPDESDDEYEAMQESARSTLLGALRSERNSVSELEAAVATLQQNNSAIAEQVQSRDQIIDELNNRVAVFEEDKLVLKAALRQLQKEMNDEAPKTQKLVDDVTAAQKEVARLSSEIEKLIRAHKKEIAGLQKLIREKEEKARVIESNMTVIGAYVDKLEERLADFTVTRRDIERRENACKKVENKAAETENEKEKLQTRVEELEAEHIELKKLLDELAQERAKLRQETVKLTTDREALKQNAQGLRQAYAKVENEAKVLRETSDQWQVRSEQSEKRLNVTLGEKERLLQQLEVSESEKSQLRQQVDGASALQQEKSSTLEKATEAKLTLERRIAELESNQEASSERHEAVIAELKRALEEQRTELEQAREVQKRAVEEAQEAIEKAAESESKRLAAEAAAAKEVEARRQGAEAAAAKEAELKRLAAEATAAKVQAALEAEAAAAEKAESKRLAAEAAAAKEAETKRKPAVGDAAKETREESAEGRIEESRNKFPIDPSIPSQHTKPTMRPKGSEIPPARPPYLPKPASSPKREFGAGLLKPEQKSLEPKPESGGLIPIKSSTNPDKPRKVPLRKLRKSFSKLTGIHGVFTAPSHPRPKRPKKNTKRKESAVKEAPSAASKNGNASTAAAAPTTPSARNEIPLRRLRKFFAKTTGIHGLFSTPSSHPQRPKAKSASTSSSVTPSKPNAIKHTLAGLQSSSSSAAPVKTASVQDSQKR